MMVPLVRSLIALAIVAGLHGAPHTVQHFNNHQVLRVQAVTPKQLELLKRLDDQGLYDFWMGPFKLLESYCDIRVSPEDKPGLLAELDKASIKYSIMVEDVERLVEEERERMSSKQSGNMSWTEYHRLDTIYTWLETLAATHEHVSLETYGRSTEGRELKLLKISTGGSGKPAFWIDANIHAREWISSAVATYIINQLINNINHADLRNAIDFYIAPMINPDGFEYTHTIDRMWRKSRSAHPTSTCKGTDLNRNFGFKWGVDDEGSSSSPCSETFRGTGPYSEPEADAAKDYIMGRANNTNWTAFITLHSYSQLWMSPYGYSERELPEDLAELVEVSNRCVAALTGIHGTPYQTGAASQILYVSNGSSRDWAKGEGGFKWVYTIELRDTGRYGFLLPPNQILPTAQETWAGIQVLARHIIA